MAEGVEELFLGLPNERLIRLVALKGKNDSPKSRFRFFHCAIAVAVRVLQHGVTRGLGVIVLDRDITAIPATEIKDTKVMRTVFSGETVYEAN